MRIYRANRGLTNCCMTFSQSERSVAAVEELTFVDATLEELLADDVLQQAVCSTGLTTAQFRALLRWYANRMKPAMN